MGALRDGRARDNMWNMMDAYAGFDRVDVSYALVCLKKTAPLSTDCELCSDVRSVKNQPIQQGPWRLKRRGRGGERREGKEIYL